MKDLFMCLLLNLKNHGNITAANLYEGGKFANLKVETESGIYSVSIAKENEGDKENA